MAAKYGIPKRNLRTAVHRKKFLELVNEDIFHPALPGTAYDPLCLFAFTPVSEALVFVCFLLYHYSLI